MLKAFVVAFHCRLPLTVRSTMPTTWSTTTVVPAGITTELAALGTAPFAHVAVLDHNPPAATAVAVFGNKRFMEKVPGQGLNGVGQVSNIM